MHPLERCPQASLVWTFQSGGVGPKWRGSRNNFTYNMNWGQRVQEKTKHKEHPSVSEDSCLKVREMQQRLSQKNKTKPFLAHIKRRIKLAIQEWLTLIDPIVLGFCLQMCFHLALSMARPCGYNLGDPSSMPSLKYLFSMCQEALSATSSLDSCHTHQGTRRTFLATPLEKFQVQLVGSNSNHSPVPKQHLWPIQVLLLAQHPHPLGKFALNWTCHVGQVTPQRRWCCQHGGAEEVLGR